MVFLKFLVTSLWLFVLSTSAASTSDGQGRPRVLDVAKNITYEGTLSSGIESFRNIRYGQDTSKNARFAGPKPFSYAPGTTVNATAVGPACPQSTRALPKLPPSGNITFQSEDCLNLRVDRVHGNNSGTLVPVMVYLYGDGYSGGTIYETSLDPAGLLLTAAANRQPIVYAGMNFRTSIFGFAATQALRQEDSLNVGLQDQRLALQWIQDNIHLFGGDPDRVTIFGQSSGATSVGQQIVAYGGATKRLFQRGIMESGGATSSENFLGNFTALHTSQVAEQVGCSQMNSTAQLLCLRAVPLDRLLNITVEYSFQQDPLGGLGVFQPISPSPFLPDRPSVLLRSGRFMHDIEIISGWNEDDGTLFVNSNVTDRASILRSIPGIQTLDNSTIDQIFQLYPVSEFAAYSPENISAQFYQGAQIVRDVQFTCPSLLLSQEIARYSNATKGAGSNYLYVLNRTAYTTFEAQEHESYLRVTHTSDLPFVFNTVSRLANASVVDKQLGQLMSGSWSNFANIGYPDGRGNQTLQNWPSGFAGSPHTNSSFSVRVIGGQRDGPTVVGGRGKSVLDSERLIERCNFWNSDKVLAQLAV